MGITFYEHDCFVFKLKINNSNDNMEILETLSTILKKEVTHTSGLSKNKKKKGLGDLRNTLP